MLLPVLLGLSACFDLDGLLFRPTEISVYKFEDYEGETLFDLPDSFDIAPEMINLLTLESDDDGDKADIYAVYIGDPIRIPRGDTVIVYCHGNNDHMDFYWPRAKLLAHLGGKHNYGVLMVEYRGFGLSGGQPSESGMYADVDAAVQWLKGQGMKGNKMILYGFSLGTAAATELAAHPRSYDPMRLILEAPFASSAIMTQDASLLSIPPYFFTNHVIDNAEEIKEVEVPFLWLHGTEDGFLRIDTHGEVVYKNYQGERSQAVRVEGAGHSTIPQTMGTESYLNTILQFIRTR